MGLKGWLGKIAGPRGYGDALGRATIENSRVLSQALQSSCEIINSNAAGISGLRSTLDRTALVFTYFLTSNAAAQYMKRQNVALFHRGLAPSVVRAAVSEGIFCDAATAQAELTAELARIDSARRMQVLNMEQPGSGDVLGLLLETLRNNLDDALTFSSIGEHGFADSARTLGQHTLRSIAGATEHYRW
jgi:hypothetical protein